MKIEHIFLRATFLILCVLATVSSFAELLQDVIAKDIGEISETPEGTSVLTITGDLSKGWHEIVIPDGCGPVDVELGGRHLSGRLVVRRSEETTGLPTHLTLRSSLPGASVSSGVCVEESATNAVYVSVGTNVVVKGAPAVLGNVWRNDGSIQGTDGESAYDDYLDPSCEMRNFPGRDGENGGVAVSGFVYCNNGTIRGGRGGAPSHDYGAGSDADAVLGDVHFNYGVIEGPESAYGVLGCVGLNAGRISSVGGSVWIDEGGEIGRLEGCIANPLDSLSSEFVYDGRVHTILGVPSIPELENHMLYSLQENGPYSTDIPSCLAVGTRTVWYVHVSDRFDQIVTNSVTLAVTPKVITDEMVQPGEDAFFFDGDARKPTVDVQHIVDGRDVCQESDYTLVYGEKVAAGWWVTVTGKGNYTGTVTKIVPVLKRIVTPPIVPSLSYNGKAQKPNVPQTTILTMRQSDGSFLSVETNLWTVLANPGGIDAGVYSNVVLRLKDPANFRWKDWPDEETDITLDFEVTKANNGWSRNPAMAGWEYGQTPGEPNLGQARYGTVQVAYRKAGDDISSETAARPELPGEYVARFYVEATDNYIGVTRDVAFEITGTAPDDPVDPPPELPEQVTALISMAADGTPEISWTPDLSDNPRIVYTVLGKENLSDAEWTPVTDANKPKMRFFKVRVELK